VTGDTIDPGSVLGSDIRVLVVDDEPLTATAHADYVRRVPGFSVAGIAATGSEALRLIKQSLNSPEDGIDLILLDMNLPDTHGLELCRRIRAAGVEVDVIAITAVRETKVVRASISVGIVQYLIKPFAFALFAEKLGNYLDFRRNFEGIETLTTQTHVDQTLAAFRNPISTQLSKGLSEETLRRVVELLREASAALSASEVAVALTISRITARRYLEYLVDAGLSERLSRYGTPGRPELEYRLGGR
jgi:response regulator of citrate/malate metabolism